MTTSRPNKIKAVKPAPNVTDEYIRAFAEIANRIQKAIKAGAPHSAEAVRMIVAGGAAQHFYTAARVSVDIDATLSKRMMLPPDLDVPFLDADGSPRVLYFDRQYNDTFALMHEDADADSRPLALPGIDANVTGAGSGLASDRRGVRPCLLPTRQTKRSRPALFAPKTGVRSCLLPDAHFRAAMAPWPVFRPVTACKVW
jgi:plasmid stabilization system protein ParE